MKTAKVYQSFLGFVEASLNPRLAELATEYGIPVAPVKRFYLGWRDPFTLTDYNAAMVVPDRISPDRGRALAQASLAVLVALKAPSVEALTGAMGVYADALADIVEMDPTSGGAAFESFVDDIDLSLPGPGSSPIGVVTVLVNLSLDQMGA